MRDDRRRISEEITNRYPGRYVKISVAEDNENGCEMDIQRELWSSVNGYDPNTINRRNKMTETHLQIKSAVETYLAENDKFENSGVKASAARARGALMDLTKLAKARRGEIQDKKNAM